jgi:hypothetical protein
MLTVTSAECHIKASYAECRYAECRGANGGVPLYSQIIEECRNFLY